MEGYTAPERAPTPYEQLSKEARTKLAELFPEAAASILAQDKESVVAGFVADVLAAQGISGASSFHRLDAQRQQKELENRSIDSLFSNLPADLIEFYRDRLGTVKKPFDPLTDESVTEM